MAVMAIPKVAFEIASREAANASAVEQDSRRRKSQGPRLDAGDRTGERLADPFSCVDLGKRVRLPKLPRRLP
jgi:hypothetical protein